MPAYPLCRGSRFRAGAVKLLAVGRSRWIAPLCGTGGAAAPWRAPQFLFSA